jgi:glycosyltransferase involved in cell wall biosynthesis
MMRIGVVSSSRIPSTTANSIQVMKICDSYKQLGYEVYLFVPKNKKVEWDQLSKLYGISHKFDIISIQTLKFLRNYDFTIVVGLLVFLMRINLIHTWLPQIALISGFLNKPYLLELHELPSGKIAPIIFRIIFASKHKKRFLPISTALKILYEDKFQFNFATDEVRIAPDGVDLDRYQNIKDLNHLREKLGINDSFLAVYTGHLYKGRGMELLIRLAEKLPEVKFLWVGGRERDVSYWKNTIYKRNIQNIIITGFIENEKIPQYQSIGDVLLMPYENQVSGSSGGNTADFCSPMKMFEYMATGKPIISSDLPVFHEILNNKNAIFCYYGNIDQWVEAILRIKNNPDTGSKLGNQAKKDVLNYSWIERANNTFYGFIDGKL